MNAFMERRVLTCRRELLNRTLIWNQRLRRRPRRGGCGAATPECGVIPQPFVLKDLYNERTVVLLSRESRLATR